MNEVKFLHARIVKSAKRKFKCHLDGTKHIVQALALGNLLKGDDTIVVGDKVILKSNSNGYVITDVKERKNTIHRLLLRENRKKISAANVDVLVIVSSVSRPKLKQGIIDRFLVRAHQWSISPIVVFNKMDEFVEGSVDLIFEEKRLSFLNVPCFEISSTIPEYKQRYLSKGYCELKELLKGRLSIFLGQSGVGKSSCISKISGSKVMLPTKAVGKKTAKGLHTTTWFEIVNCGDFEIIDSPGIRQFSLEDLQGTHFIEYWPDLEAISVNCEFKNCEHKEQSKGCAFYPTKVDSLFLSRLSSYRRILEEISHNV